MQENRTLSLEIENTFVETQVSSINAPLTLQWGKGGVGGDTHGKRGKRRGTDGLPKAIFSGRIPAGMSMKTELKGGELK